MIVALCQINSKVGDLSYNREKIIKYYNKSIILNADIVVFPEMAITGYPPQDLLFRELFIEQNLKTLEIIARHSSIPMIIGYVRKASTGLFNSAAICYDGKLQASFDKILLPSYDVFDEKRYFNSGKYPKIHSLKHNNLNTKIGIQICEDMWDDKYLCKVSKEQKKMGANMIINISASPYSINAFNTRKSIIEDKVSKLNIPFYYCNMVGGQDELIFDGRSIIMNENCKIIGTGKPFEEQVIIVNSQEKNEFKLTKEPLEKSLYQALCLGVKDYFFKTGYKKAVLGLSGGIDSSLVACIAVEALGNQNVYGISMPSKFSSDHSLTDATKLAKNLDIDFRIIPIQENVDSIEKSLKKHFHNLSRDTTEENIQSRVRGNILMALSNKFGWMALSTGNKTELAMGYCTLYGDMSGGLSVISDVSKNNVYKISRWINKTYKDLIPENCIHKIPSAELTYNQVDPFDYSKISPLIDLIIESDVSMEKLIIEGFDEKLVNLAFNKIRLNEFKRRQSAPGLRITAKAFGIGRRYPIVNNFRG